MIRRAGQLRHRINIQKKVVTRDTYGAETITWADIATVWASVSPMRGREYRESRQIQTDTTYKIMMRYQAITPENRITFKGRIFDIEAVINAESRDIMTEVTARYSEQITS